MYRKYNSCLINKYVGGSDHIPPHSDHQTDFGENPTISILSLKDERPMVFERQDDREGEKIIIPMEKNSILIMAGATQKHYFHSVPECDKETTRYSMTFRNHEKR